MKRPWMPLYVGDYLADTGHLSTTQHGAYLLLIMHYWRTGGLPNEDRQLAKITKLPLKIWTEAVRPAMEDLFHEVDGDPWRHGRIDAELEKMIKVSEKRALAGQMGGMWSAIAAQRRARGEPVEPRRSKKTGLKPLISHVSSQANAEHLPSNTAANVHHSHSHKTISSAEQVETQQTSNGEYPVSPELRALLATK